MDWMRPDWWPDWVPKVDDAGHELVPARVSLHRCGCLHEVHYYFRCVVSECRTIYKPPGCVGPDPNPR